MESNRLHQKSYYSPHAVSPATNLQWDLSVERLCHLSCIFAKICTFSIKSYRVSPQVLRDGSIWETKNTFNQIEIRNLNMSEVSLPSRSSRSYDIVSKNNERELPQNVNIVSTYKRKPSLRGKYTYC